MGKNVTSAGGLIVRDGEVLLIHTKKGWELPKGRVEKGERLDETAIREVLEETGYFCFLGESLPPVTYTTSGGDTKTVQFWRMSVRTQVSLRPLDPTILSAKWFSIQSAMGLVRYPHQREIIEKHARS